jgi:hypothetical protein
MIDESANTEHVGTADAVRTSAAPALEAFMSSHSGTDPALEVVRALPWIEDPVPTRTTSVASLGVPGIGVTFARLPQDPKQRDETLEDLRQMFSPETVEELTKHEDEVFARLAQNPSAAAHLLTDPVTALDALGVKLSARALAELKTIRQKMITPQALQALAVIKQLSIKVDASTGGK